MTEEQLKREHEKLAKMNSAIDSEMFRVQWNYDLDCFEAIDYLVESWEGE